LTFQIFIDNLLDACEKLKLEHVTKNITRAKLKAKLKSKVYVVFVDIETGKASHANIGKFRNNSGWRAPSPQSQKVMHASCLKDKWQKLQKELPFDVSDSADAIIHANCWLYCTRDFSKVAFFDTSESDSPANPKVDFRDILEKRTTASTAEYGLVLSGKQTYEADKFINYLSSTFMS